MRLSYAIVLLSASGLAAQERILPSGGPFNAPSPAALAGLIDRAYEGGKPTEAAKMLASILRGSNMGPGEGWFGPAESRYTYPWLAKSCGVELRAGVSKDAWKGPPELFARLDRNKDGLIRGDDFDWSDDSPYLQMAGMVNRIFRRLDAKGAGTISKADWQAFFDKATQGKDVLSPEDLRDAILGGFGASSFSPGDAPANPGVLIRGLFAGEIGSFNEGPKVDQPAPNFILKRSDGKGSVELSKLTGERPVVLVFGNFTCGPFRSMYPGVDEVYSRYKDRANFLMVYVREAHPTDGWKMASNAKSGVEVKQPTTFDDRFEVANQFCTKLKPNLPVVVDEITDPIGHAYSGMPARLYVLDRQGKVAYKGGRGPFGFKVGEMEQALAMSLFEAAKK